jgi:hypothetical protein
MGSRRTTDSGWHSIPLHDDSTSASRLAKDSWDFVLARRGRSLKFRALTILRDPEKTRKCWPLEPGSGKRGRRPAAPDRPHRATGLLVSNYLHTEPTPRPICLENPVLEGFPNDRFPPTQPSSISGLSSHSRAGCVCVIHAGIMIATADLSRLFLTCRGTHMECGRSTKLRDQMPNTGCNSVPLSLLRGERRSWTVSHGRCTPNRADLQCTSTAYWMANMWQSGTYCRGVANHH